VRRLPSRKERGFPFTIKTKIQVWSHPPHQRSVEQVASLVGDELRTLHRGANANIQLVTFDYDTQEVLRRWSWCMFPQYVPWMPSQMRWRLPCEGQRRQMCNRRTLPVTIEVGLSLFDLHWLDSGMNQTHLHQLALSILDIVTGVLRLTYIYIRYGQDTEL
jgi:hypothetical protein